MTRNTKIALAALLLAAFASPAFAHDEWMVDSGRYLSGDAPSYTTRASSYAMRTPRLIEGRYSAYIDGGSSHFDRDAMVQTPGN
jgi:hypothetical protein